VSGLRDRVSTPAWKLAPLLLTLTLALPAAAAAQAPADANRAGLIVQPGDGETVIQCVAFEDHSITGMDLLERSNLPLAIDQTHGLGAIVCSIDGQGCDYPGEACFCECQGTPCYYWNYYYLTADGWQYGHLGATARTLGDGDVDAWVWGDTRSSRDTLPDITFDQVCPPAEAETAIGVTPTGAPTGDRRPGDVSPVAPSTTRPAAAAGPASEALHQATAVTAAGSASPGQTATRPAGATDQPQSGSGAPLCPGVLALTVAVGVIVVRGRQQV
jgi:hypothetical protein